MEENKNDKKLNNSESDEESNSEDYKRMKMTEQKKEKNLGKILRTIVKKTKKIKTDYILSKNKVPLEKLKQEEIESNKKKEKKMLHDIRIRLGYVKYDEWDKSYEKKLLKTTRRGIVKLFNSIVEYRKKEIDLQKAEEIKVNKKSKNFLMMHNLTQLGQDNESNEDEEVIDIEKDKKKNKGNKSENNKKENKRTKSY